MIAIIGGILSRQNLSLAKGIDGVTVACTEIMANYFCYHLMQSVASAIYSHSKKIAIGCLLVVFNKFIVIDRFLSIFSGIHFVRDVCFCLICYGTFAFTLSSYPTAHIYQIRLSFLFSILPHSIATFCTHTLSHLQIANGKWQMANRIFSIICNFRYGERSVMHTRCSVSLSFLFRISFIFMGIVTIRCVKRNKFWSN